MIYKNLGQKKLCKVISEQGLTYDAAAEKAGVSKHTIWFWCAGKRVPMICGAYKVQEVFGIEMLDWIKQIDQQETV